LKKVSKFYLMIIFYFFTEQPLEIHQSTTLKGKTHNCLKNVYTILLSPSAVITQHYLAYGLRK